MSESPDLFVFVDIETTGLDPNRDRILEVGIVATDLEYYPLCKTSEVIAYGKHNAEYFKKQSDEFVQNMHEENNLWNEIANSTPGIGEVEERLCDWMSEYALTGRPMYGSSLALDRSFLRVHMPKFHDLFHYRSIDNSTIKELCRSLDPELYMKLPNFDTDHRVDTCLEATIAEAKFYSENFLFTTEG